MITSHEVFTMTPYCCVLSGEATSNTVVIFGLTEDRKQDLPQGTPLMRLIIFDNLIIFATIIH